MKVFVSSLCAYALFIAPSLARPPANEQIDPATSNWYQSLRQPKTGGGCCTFADCRPTELRQSPTDSSKWEAFISKELFGPDAPDAWMTIPDDKIIQHKDNPTGRVVICWFNQQIYCAVLPTLF